MQVSSNNIGSSTLKKTCRTVAFKMDALKTQMVKSTKRRMMMKTKSTLMKRFMTMALS